MKSTDGRSFHSKLERSVYEILKIHEKANTIDILQCQAQVELTDAKIIYKPDFKCRWVSNGEIFYVEAKGFETPEWKIKKRLWEFYGPAELEIWGGSHERPKKLTVIKPVGIQKSNE